MQQITSKFQELLGRSLPSIQIKEVSNRLINLEPKTKGIYLGIESPNRIELEDTRRFMGLIGAGFQTTLESGGRRTDVYFVALREGDR